MKTDFENPPAIDKERCLAWFKQLVIDNPDVEIVSYSSGMYRTVNGTRDVVFDPQHASVELRKAR